MKNENPSVLLVADVQETDLPPNLTQEWESLESIDYLKSCLEESGERVESVGSPSDLLERLSFFRLYLFPKDRYSSIWSRAFYPGTARLGFLRLLNISVFRIPVPTLMLIR